MMLHSLAAEPGDVREYGFALRKDGGDAFVTVGIQMCTGEVKKFESTRTLTLDEWRGVFDFIHGNEHQRLTPDAQTPNKARRRAPDCPECGAAPLTLCAPGCTYAAQRNA